MISLEITWRERNGGGYFFSKFSIKSINVCMIVDISCLDTVHMYHRYSCLRMILTRLIVPHTSGAGVWHDYLFQQVRIVPYVLYFVP